VSASVGNNDPSPNLPQLCPHKPQILSDELLLPPPYISATNNNTPDDTNICFTTPTDPNTNVKDVFQTTPDSYSVYYKYSNGKPSITPDE